MTEEASTTVALYGIVSKLAGAVPAIRAISRLISGVADVPTAWLASHAQRIRVNSDARTQIMRSLAAAAARTAARDKALVGRAIDRWTIDLVRKQENREAVAIKTVEHLQEHPPEPQLDEGPSDDFMNTFEAVAERASSEKLRDLLARVLAGEIRKPSTFSLRTLHVLSVIDQPLATALQQARAWVIGLSIPFARPINEQPLYQVIFALQEAGLLEVGLEHRAQLTSSGQFLLPFLGTDIGLLLKGIATAEFVMPVAVLTTAGNQLMGLLPASTDVELYKELAHGLVEAAHAPFGDWRITGNSVDLKPVKEVAIIRVISPAPDRFEIGDELWVSTGSPTTL